MSDPQDSKPTSIADRWAGMSDTKGAQVRQRETVITARPVKISATVVLVGLLIFLTTIAIGPSNLRLAIMIIWLLAGFKLYDLVSAALAGLEGVVAGPPRE